MHKSGTGLIGVMVVGLMLSSLAAAADATQPAAADTPAAQATTGDAPSQPATVAPAAQAPATPAETPAAPAQAPTTAPAQGSTDAPAQAPAPAAAPAKKADKANKATAEKTDKATADKEKAKTSAAGKGKAAAAQPVKNFKLSPCPDLNAPQIAELIKQDYTQNRFPRFEDDKQALGGDTVVANVNPEDITGTGDIWQAPLKIRGQTADRNYQVNLDCQKGDISYQLIP